MNKIKKLFSTMIDSVKKSLKTFPVTIITIFVLTLIVAFFRIGTDLTYEMGEVINHIFAIGTIAAFGTLFTEAVFSNKKDLRNVIFYIASFVIAIIFDRLLDSETADLELAGRWLMEYLIVCILGSIYVLLKRSNTTLEKYILNVSQHLGEASGVFFITTLGFLFLYFIFVILILETLEFEFFLKVFCIFTGFYYIPVMIKAFEGEEVESSKFNKVIFVKVLLPLLLLAMLIIYIYIVKIFTFSQVPKNQLFMILSVIFIFAFPIHIINKNYTEEGSFVHKVNKAIPYLYIPFIFLQIYSMGTRVKAYGLTTPRYLAVVFIVCEIFAIFLSIYKNSKYLKEMILIIIGVTFIIIVTPFNLERVPYLSQKAIVDKYVKDSRRNGTKFDDLSDGYKKKVAGAYQYIMWKDEYINPDLTDAEKEMLASYKIHDYWFYDYNDDTNYNSKKYYNFYKDLYELNIVEYKNMYLLPYTYCFNDATIEYRNNKVNLRVNIRDYIDELIEADKISYNQSRKLFEEDKIIKVDDTTDLYLKRLSFDYDEDNDELEDINVEGFILKK